VNGVDALTWQSHGRRRRAVLAAAAAAYAMIALFTLDGLPRDCLRCVCKAVRTIELRDGASFGDMLRDVRRVALACRALREAVGSGDHWRRRNDDGVERALRRMNDRFAWVANERWRFCELLLGVNGLSTEMTCYVYGHHYHVVVQLHNDAGCVKSWLDAFAVEFNPPLSDDGCSPSFASCVTLKRDVRNNSGWRLTTRRSPDVASLEFSINVCSFYGRPKDDVCLSADLRLHDDQVRASGCRRIELARIRPFYDAFCRVAMRATIQRVAIASADRVDYIVRHTDAAVARIMQKKSRRKGDGARHWWFPEK